jgi:hypothetical protein
MKHLISSAILLFVAAVTVVNSFSIPKFNIPTYTFDIEKISKSSRNVNLIGGSMLAICLLTASPVFADLASDDSADIESVAPRAMKITSQADDISQVQKKSSVLKSSANKETVVADDRSYSNSLKKEQAIQESRKKTKAERAKDMCEMMGRGC